MSFCLLAAWLLAACCSDSSLSAQRRYRGARLRRLILAPPLSPASPTQDPAPSGLLPRGHRRAHSGLGEEPDGPTSRRSHQRSKSDTTAVGERPYEEVRERERERERDLD